MPERLSEITEVLRSKPLKVREVSAAGITDVEVMIGAGKKKDYKAAMKEKELGLGFFLFFLRCKPALIPCRICETCVFHLLE